MELNERLQLEAAANQHRCPMRIELCTARAGAASAGKRQHLGMQTGFEWVTGGGEMVWGGGKAGEAGWSGLVSRGWIVVCTVTTHW